MPKASGRSLIRSPFPIDESPPTGVAPSSEEQQHVRSEDNRSLADAITHKHPAVSSAKRGPLADVETRKNQAVRAPLHRPGGLLSTPRPSLPRPANVLPINGATPQTSSQLNGVVPAQRGFAPVPGTSLHRPANVLPINNAAPLPGVSTSLSPQRILPSSLPHAPTATPAPASTPLPLLKRAGRLRWKTRTRRQKVQLLLMAALVLVPSCLILFELISAVVIYRQLQDGVAQLQAVQSAFHTTSGNGLEAYFDSVRLHQAQDDIDAAQADFASLNEKFEYDGSISLAANLFPSQISTARKLSQLAVTGMDVAQHVLQTMQTIAPTVGPALRQSIKSGDTQHVPLTPYLTPSSYQVVATTLQTIAPLVHQMAGETQGLALDTLPLSEKQRATLTSLLPLLPTLDAALPQISDAKDTLGWLLGIDSQRTFLVEPMDSAELRATGGFTGQFGELVLNGAHMGPLKLSNIGKYEEDHTAEGSPPDLTVYPKVIGQGAPLPYGDWWPIGNFGLRDANLSADFPTSAGIIMDRYKYEFNTSLDGVLLFTPTLIQHVLHVTGPISIPAYNEVITEQNLADRLHYYQLDNAGIRREEIIEHVNDNQVARKLFTQRVTQTLMATVTHLPLDKLFSLLGEMFLSMKSRDLQVYFKNQQLQDLVAKYGSTASLDRSSNHDGLLIVQSNLSASKASQYVHTSIQDSVALNALGGATHELHLTLDYQQKGDVYGFDTYYDYVRIYVPPGSRLLKGNGFDQYDKPYCGDEKSGYTLCQADVYGDGALMCTPPVEMGYATSYLHDPYSGKDHPLDLVGLPQNLQSDESGRAMFGGWVVIPKNCTMKVMLSWYVPPPNRQPYHLLIQSQASVYAPLDLSIQPAEKMCGRVPRQALHFAQRMDGTDLSFTVKQQGTLCTLVVH